MSVVKDVGKFVSELEDSEVGKIVDLAKKVQPWVSLILGLLEQESDIERLESRIESLGSVVTYGFAELGYLVKRQIMIVLEAIDRLKLEVAQKEAEGAMRVLYTYTKTGSVEYLAEADGLSAQAVSFLKQQFDPFFVPGMLMAGSVRLDVLNA